VTLAMDGLTNAEIAARMGIASATVKVHMREACDRLGIYDQAPNGRRLVAALIKGGWLSWTGKRL
jgi:DNA-binding NarL/FixJ family response regulator